MKINSRPQRALVAFLASLSMIGAQLSPLFLAAPSAQAANGTWLNTGTSANWTNTTNWLGGTVPGATTAITGSNANADTAIFNTAVGTFGTSGSAIFIDSASENIRGITFDTAAGSYFIGGTAGNSLYLSSGGTTQILSTLTGTNVVETINAPLVIESANGTYTLQNASTSGTGAGSGTLKIGGQISGGAAGATVLTLDGINTNANTISGNIINGTATTLAITKTGFGTWMLTGSNSYTGATTINSGTLNLGGGGATGSISSSSPLSMGGGTLTFTRTGTNTQTFAGTTFTGGYSSINTTVASDTLALGALSQTAGSGASVNFGTTGTTTTTSTNTNGILGGWAMVGNSGATGATADWAAVSGSGTIITYAGYNSVTGTTAPVAAQNWKTTGITTVAVSGTINSLVQSQDFSVLSGATLTINSGGLIMSGSARWFLNNGAGSTAGTGKITSGLASGELFVDVADAQYNNGGDANNWRIWTNIVNGTNPRFWSRMVLGH